MKIDFDKCLPIELKIEGGLVNDPSDPGGLTNLGVTRARWSEWLGRPVTVDEMKALTPATVSPLYKAGYWDHLRCDDLPAGVDWMVFDCGVNQGPARAATWLQLAAQMVIPDGIVGPLTVAAVQKVGAVEVIGRLYNRRWLAYRQDPDFVHFGDGWLARLERVRDQALAMAAGQELAA